MSKYKWILVITFITVWIWAAIRPKYPHDWLLENILVFVFVPVIFLMSRYFKLSNLSYTLLTLFFIFHLIGSHYTYAEVPFGYMLQKFFKADRNMYDRLIHFSFGFLVAYPIREFLMRIVKVKGFWSYYLPFDVTLSFSGVYEIVEWLAAINVNEAAGIAFLGAQGDIWDAQKDMLMAAIGALLAMSIIAIINLKYNNKFVEDIKESLKPSYNDEILGEVKLKKMIERGNNKNESI
ncbi:MAG: hypothetical protein A2539_02535 [Elusimicrobia bacterium RIFOXYD2_FULL_34_15]|nr:MAG: hypothetical protein A2539_02535 [Elusimicrobia bacterium RIFOXYD2_FULL_34_15]